MTKTIHSDAFCKDALRLRAKAITQHDRLASEFDSKYRLRSDSDYSSSFLYGRSKIDILLRETLESFPTGSRVLDLGCGTGEQVRFCRQLGYEVAGLEPAGGMRAIALRNNPGAAILNGTITDLPFEEECFDLVLAIEVLRYLHPVDIERSYGEMLRVLKPGGKMFVTLVNRYAWDGFAVFDRLKRWTLKAMGRPLPAHCELVTPAAVRRRFEELGIDDIEFHGRLFGPLRIAYRCHRLLGKALASTLSPLDDAFCRMPWTVPFAGHLIVIPTKPALPPVVATAAAA